MADLFESSKKKGREQYKEGIEMLFIWNACIVFWDEGLVVI